jgi:hypothetical protein
MKTSELLPLDQTRLPGFHYAFPLHPYPNTKVNFPGLDLPLASVVATDMALRRFDCCASPPSSRTRPLKKERQKIMKCESDKQHFKCD